MGHGDGTIRRQDIKNFTCNCFSLSCYRNIPRGHTKRLDRRIDNLHIAISVIVIVTVANDYAKEKQFQKLMEAKEDQYCAVIRNGDFINISIYKLLVGDLVQIMEGDSVPADIVLIQGTKITADEANITGEPEHLTKTAL